MRRLRALPRWIYSACLGLTNRHVIWRARPFKIALNTETAHVELHWWRAHIGLKGQLSAGALNVAFDQGAATQVSGSFDIMLNRSRPQSAVSIEFTCGDDRQTVKLAAPGAFRRAFASFQALPAAARAIYQARADLWTFLTTTDQTAAARLRIHFGLTAPQDRACPLPGKLLAEPTCPGLSQSPTIIVPIFNAPGDLARLLGRILNEPSKIILVNDGSDHPDISPMLRTFKNSRQHPTNILELKENKGFIAAVNAGLSRCDGHVILLNTDTLPPPNWVPRLMQPILTDARVATVTPLSNSAEILSVPSQVAQHNIDGKLVDAIDQIAARIAAPNHCETVPTGIGFCMAMNGQFIEKIGGFDPVFGRGYGEEVDWCQRARAEGGHHVAACNLFVGHRGGASFGAEKTDRLQDAAKLNNKRHPRFDSEVRKWGIAAPIAPQKLALSLAWLAAKSTDQVPIFLAHSLGGGAETALQNEAEQCFQTGAPGLIVLRVGGPMSWRIELVTPAFTSAGETNDIAVILNLLEPVTRRKIVYSCGVGAQDAAQLPAILRQLVLPKCALEFRFHDFFPISPSWNLLDHKGSYAGVPDINTDDPAHRTPSSTHAEWRANWASTLRHANKIVAFSPSSAALISQAFPDATDIEIRPHTLPITPAKIQKPGQTIGVLGGINLAKGGGVIKALSHISKRRIVIIGELDGQFKLAHPHHVHGRYDNRRISEIAQSFDVGLWLIPSICPETFSFATHEALATGLPVLAFDRGAQGEAVATHKNGHLIASDPTDTATLDNQINSIMTKP